MQINLSWSDFKAFVQNRQVLIQYVLTDETYFIWATDDGTEVSTQIPFVSPTPPGSDQQDFEQNYLPFANRPLDRRSPTGAIQVDALLVDGQGNTISFDTNGVINTNIVSGNVSLVSSGIPSSTYSEILGVESGITTTILSYMVPNGTTLLVRHITGSGDNIAKYMVLIDSNVVDKKRSYYTDFNVDFFFESDVQQGLVVLQGSTLELNVLHTSLMPGDFNGSVYGELQS